jgi:hypothetical protein
MAQPVSQPAVCSNGLKLQYLQYRVIYYRSLSGKLEYILSQNYRMCGPSGSIPDGVNGIFHYHDPFCRTMALGSTQPLTEMITRIISRRVEAAGA